jgi:hypothetical protein
MLTIGFQYEPVLHDSVRAAFAHEPQAQVFQVFVEGPKASNLDSRLCLRGSGHHAYDDEGLANIDTGTSLNYCLNHAPSLCQTEANVSGRRLFHGLDGSNRWCSCIGQINFTRRGLPANANHDLFSLASYSLRLKFLFILGGGRSRPCNFTGNDAETHYTQNGTLVVTLSVATKESWKDADGNWQTRTEWHRIVSFGKPAEFTWTLNKGSYVMAQGAVRTREYERDGVKRRVVEVRGETVGKLDRAERRAEAAGESNGGEAD